MGLKEKMGDWMMGNMKPEEKKEMMDAMMDNFFAQMPPEEKQKMMQGMMDKFFSGISAEEKSQMMQGMMKNMMGGGFSMRDMMSGMMGGRRDAGSGEGMPWDMCKKMMSSISASSEMASFATPEVRSLFNDWAEQIEAEMLQYIQEKQTADPAELAAHFKISQPSASFFLNRLVQKGKIHLKAEKL